MQIENIRTNRGIIIFLHFLLFFWLWWFLSSWTKSLGWIIKFDVHKYSVLLILLLDNGIVLVFKKSLFIFWNCLFHYLITLLLIIIFLLFICAACSLILRHAFNFFIIRLPSVLRIYDNSFFEVNFKLTTFGSSSMFFF